MRCQSKKIREEQWRSNQRKGKEYEMRDCFYKYRILGIEINWRIIRRKLEQRQAKESNSRHKIKICILTTVTTISFRYLEESFFAHSCHHQSHRPIIDWKGKWKEKIREKTVKRKKIWNKKHEMKCLRSTKSHTYTITDTQQSHKITMSCNIYQHWSVYQTPPILT